MGTNPKRTVTVQMVPQLAVIDTLGNKEPNANWANEPSLQLSQVCPKTTLTSPDHTQDNSSLTAAPDITQIPNTASKGGEPVCSTVSDKPVPTNGNQTKTEPVTGGDQQMQDPSLTSQSVDEAGRDQRDSNANIKMISQADKKDICKADTALTALKIDMQNNDCRIKGPSAAEEECAKLASSSREDSNKNVPASNTNLNNPCELRHTSSEPQHDNKESSTAPKNKDTAVPQKLQELDHMCSSSQSSVSAKETPKAQQRIETTAASHCSTTPPSKSNDVEVRCTDTTSSSSHPEKDMPPVKKAQVSSDKQQPASSQKDLSTLDDPKETPKAKQSIETTAASHCSTTPQSKSKDAELRCTDTTSSSTHPENMPPEKKPHVSSDKHHPASSQKDSSTLPQASQIMKADASEEATQINTSVSEGQQQLGKLFKEASTMTLSPFPTPVKQLHDMEVQAVANTCSKAVSTSPSLLPFTVPRNGGAVPREAAQSLAVVYQADGGVGIHQISMSPLPTDPRSERLTVEAEMCPNQNVGVVFPLETLSQQQNKRLGAKPKDSALCNTQPVYQINIEHSNPKEQGETGNSQNTTSVQKSTAKTATAEAPTLISGKTQETAGASKAGSADSNKAVLSQAAVNTKPTQAPPTATKTASKPEPRKVKAASPKQKAKAGGKASKKETKSSKQKMEQERKKEEDELREKGIHDVVWDEQGMTWEVYGASVDPESLGFAIQSHLQCKIKEQERKLVVQTSIRKSDSGADSPAHGKKNKRRQQNIFRSMLQNVRRPNCCVNPPSSAVLE
ncbi:G protein-regulated inducer of neurite outgrowth 3 [Gymnodraco acuticeps]|uniref:G protein-regulated inducer of neurite outgrowth 3 n=1 Tax=Gymnodraco acuticeps TaxID=8218 RepID=A0A6P8WJ00_GYMAC|nr:G protein-regulated inducer of neurite outgrowth 3 [Gymnodraco acuticeps]